MLIARVYESVYLVSFFNYNVRNVDNHFMITILWLSCLIKTHQISCIVIKNILYAM